MMYIVALGECVIAAGIPINDVLPLGRTVGERYAAMFAVSQKREEKKRVTCAKNELGYNHVLLLGGAELCCQRHGQAGASRVSK